MKIATAEHFKMWRHIFASYSDDQLAFARIDCRDAGRAMPEDAGFYNDQASVVVAELSRRAARGRNKNRGV